MEAQIKKAAVSLFLVVVGSWLMIYCRQQREVVFSLFEPTLKTADRLSAFPEAQNRIGFHQWFQNQPEAALTLYQKALAGNFLLVDAWLKMGEIEAAKGNKERARDILVFTDRLAPGVQRWKWQQALLALDLDLRDLFIRAINDLIPQILHRENALFVIDQEYESVADAVGTALSSDNLPHYLSWLMQGQRVDDARVVWKKMTHAQKSEKDMHERYVHFLLSHRRIAEAKTVWGKTGLTNPGFEEEITHRGFDWRWHNPKDDSWMVKRIFLPDPKRMHAVQVSFSGRENIDFYHLSQVFPVKPGESYTIMFEWRSQGLTTDQRPFAEVYGYECKGLYAKGSMAQENSEWHSEELPFTVPEGCEAAVVRLRRLKSSRIDSKIEGKIWLDNFR